MAAHHSITCRLSVAVYGRLRGSGVVAASAGRIPIEPRPRQHPASPRRNRVGTAWRQRFPPGGTSVVAAHASALRDPPSLRAMAAAPTAVTRQA